jgi:hypothetical protein
VTILELDHVQHRVDEREVREGLREVAEVLPAVRVDLLAIELQRAGERQQLGTQLARLVDLADLTQGRDQPERADGERALLAVEPVVGLLHLVAQDEPVHRELAPDRHHGVANPRVVRGQEPHQRRQQQ